MLKIPPISIAKDILNELAALECPQRTDLAKAVRKRLKHTDYAFPTAIQYWEAYRELDLKNEALEKVLRVKDIRTDSGVAPITVLTKPFPCPGRCVYCPTEERMPKSYLSNEPAAARALSLQFDPYEQVRQRIQALERNGHQANKIELIIKGGTWSAYKQDYREWFITRCFEAANNITHPSLDSLGTPSLKLREGEVSIANGGELWTAQKINETAEYRIIGLTIETRPDWVKPKEVIHLRKLGCTRVELGLQILNDRVLAFTKRGHTVEQAADAIALLKTAGLKADVHILPGQPGASIQDDIDSFALLFGDPRFCPDMIKLYPCVVLPNSELASWTERGEFKPLEGQDLQELLIKMQTMLPRYCRVSRMIRDFPTPSIAFGNKQSNLRELLDAEMKKRGIKCQCLRCREVGHVPGDHTNDKTQIFEERYENAGGTEIFLSVENEDRSAVFGFCRLRLPLTPCPYSHRMGEGCEEVLESFPVLNNAAIIRELHTYGTALNINQYNQEASQHKGYGRLLMQTAEDIAKREGYEKMAVISGIGVREYYKTLGYAEQDTYMTKKLTTYNSQE
ncbi:MAG: tRNA uridine(34) 5-carboxymethylaminomethyl modification radical SAM/GNAT enzyme Elp3 [Patescibacteria group bacterium]|jgi:elongator complex protein 3